jgi:FixJ family two-component response regulator
MYLIPVLEKAWRRLSDTVPDQSPTSEAVLIDQNRNDRFREALDCLTDTQRQCLQLRAEGLMYRQIADAMHMSVSVSNSLSGRHWELDQVPAVRDPAHIVQLGTGHRVSAGEGQRRVAIQ